MFLIGGFGNHHRVVAVQGTQTRISKAYQIRAPFTNPHGIWAIGEGLRLLGVRASVVTGDAGNREFFVLLRKPGPS